MPNLIITNAGNSTFCMNCGQPSEHYAKQFPSESSATAKRLCANCINKWDREIEVAKQEELKRNEDGNKTTGENDKSSTEEKIPLQDKNTNNTSKEQSKSNEIKKGTVNEGDSERAINSTQSSIPIRDNVQKSHS